MKPALGMHLDLAPLDVRGIVPSTTKALVAPVVLTWTGVRDYMIDGQRVRILRRPTQVFAPRHLARLRLVTATRDHPTYHLASGGRAPVLLSAGPATGVPGPSGFVRRPHAEYSVGTTGDALTEKLVNGYRMPTGLVSVTDPATIRAIRDGLTHASLGYLALRWAPPAAELQPGGTGVWQGPLGPEGYDLEHVVDPDDERASPESLVEAGVVDDLAEGREVNDELGPNHEAVAIPLGRGGPGVEVLLDAARPAPPHPALGAFVDCGAAYATRLRHARNDNAVDTARNDGASIEIAPRPTANGVAKVKHKIKSLLPRLARVADGPAMNATLDLDEEGMSILAALDETIGAAMEALAAAKAEIAAKLGTAEEGMTSANDEAAAAKAGAEKLHGAMDALRAKYDALVEEYAPVKAERDRAAKVAAARVAGIADSKIDKWVESQATPADARRAAVLARCPSVLTTETDAYIQGRYDGLVPAELAKTRTADAPSAAFLAAATRDRRPANDSAEKSIGEMLAAELDAAFCGSASN